MKYPLNFVDDLYKEAGLQTEIVPGQDWIIQAPPQTSKTQGMIQCPVPYHKDTNDLAAQSIRYSKRKGSTQLLHQQGLVLRTHTAMLDIDLNAQPGSPVAHLPAIGRPKVPWSEFPPEAREALMTRVQDWLTGFGPSCYYPTRHGLRIVFFLPIPIEIGISGHRFEQFTQELMTISNRCQIVPDPSCADWTRLFRLPFPDQENGPPQFFDPDPCPWLIDNLDEEQQALTELANHEKAGLPLLTPPTDANITIPDEPKDLELARAALPPWLREALTNKLEMLSSSRNPRLLKGTTAVAEALALTPYATYEYVFHLLAPVAHEFGQDVSANAPYLADLPRLASTAADNAQSGARTIKAMEKATATPGHPELTMEQLGERFVKHLRVSIPELPETSTPEDALTLARHQKKLMLYDDHTGKFAPLMPNGYYCPQMVSINALEAMMSKEGFPGLIELYYMQDGKTKAKTVRQLVTEYCTVINEYIMRFGHDGSILIPGLRKNDIGICNMLKNPMLRPVFHKQAREWLEHTFGLKLDDALLAILPLGCPEDGPTATVCLIGPPDSGKNMIVEGLVEWFLPAGSAKADCITTEFNDDLIKFCIIHIDEGFPVSSSKNIADELRRLSNNSGKSFNPKMKPKIWSQGIHRAIITANNPNFMEKLIGNSTLTEADKRALSQRIVMIHTQEAGAAFFADKAARVYTEGWIADPPKRESKYIVAQHLLWELERLVPKDSNGRRIWPAGRFLCTGTMTNELTDHLDQPANDAERDTLLGIVSILSNPLRSMCSHIDRDGKAAWINSKEVFDGSRRREEDECKAKQREIAAVIMNYSNGAQKRSEHGPRLHQIPLSRLQTKMSIVGIMASGALKIALEKLP